MGDEEIRREVISVMKRWRDPYERFFRDVYRELSEFRHLPQNSQIVYRLYSRVDKQKGNDPLKTVESIARKISKWRRDGSRVTVRDIHDIIAITIVTYFNSEIEPLIERLTLKDQFNSFRVKEVRPPDSPGYHAFHLELEGKGQNKYQQLKCELQVKTLLNDGWATRTHDLNYKPRGIKNIAIDGIIASIGEMVQSIERQSDQLKILIEKGRDQGAQRKARAVKRLSFALTQYPQGPDGREYADLAVRIESRADYISSCKFDDPEFADIIGRWHELKNNNGLSKSACRLIVYAALWRKTRDLDEIALDAVDTWLDQINDPKELASGLGFKALCYWILDDFDQAINIGEEWIRFVEAQNFVEPDLSYHRASALLDTAYFRAERLYLNPSDNKITKIEEENRILEMLNAAPVAENERDRMVDQDTRGAIIVMIASTLEQLLEGRKLYHDAYLWSRQSKPDIEVFDDFYAHHELIYRHRAEEI